MCTGLGNNLPLSFPYIPWWSAVSSRILSSIVFSLALMLSLSILPACGTQQTPTVAPVVDEPAESPLPGGGGSTSGSYNWDGPAIYVAPDGHDTSDCGGPGTPCATLRAGLSLSAPGAAVLVKAGEYRESFVYMRHGVSVISIDGPLAASIYSGDRSAIRFENANGATLQGFEIHGDWNQGQPGDGLVRVLDANHSTIRDCVIYDASYDADVIKVSGDVDGLLIENVVVFNPGQRDQSRNLCGTSEWYQENIDIFGRGRDGTSEAQVRNVTLRGSWLFHTQERGGDWLIYSKINCENILYENNVFGPSAGGGCGNAAVGIGTSEAGIPDPTQAVVRGAIVRNNIFTGIHGDAALAVMNSENVWVYNNTFWGNGGDGLRSVVMVRGNAVPVEKIWVFNNIFENNMPAARGDGRLFWVREGGVSQFYHDHNLYYGDVSTSDVDITQEGNSLFDVSAMLMAPRVPATNIWSVQRVREIAAGFEPASDSPVLSAGVSALDFPEHPDWDPSVTGLAWDILGDARSGPNWDLGGVERP